jgi:hypothetical protein
MSSQEHVATGAAPDAAHGRLLSTLRFKVILSVFVVLLIVALSALNFALVSRIFDRLEPTLRADLEWKTKRGAIELSGSADLGLALRDPKLIEQATADFRQSPDVLALVATDAAGAVLYQHGSTREPIARIFAGQPAQVQAGPGYLWSWADSAIEGNRVGRVAVFTSAARLESGQKLRRNLLAAGIIGCILALGVSLFFVNLYLGPLISLTHTGLRQARELEIAKRIQTSILPRRPRLASAEVAATMVTATEVGGDYYDVVPHGDGAWIAIGDVAGHGVQAGVVMLMVQSAFSGLVRKAETTSPSEIVVPLNAVLHENVRHRLMSDEHVTFCLFHYAPDGSVRFAGAHEEILVLRKATGRCERLDTRGAWLGAVQDVSPVTRDDTLHLEPGDTFVLHTDGLSEARGRDGRQFGVQGLITSIEKRAALSPQEICDGILADVRAFMTVQDDDISLLVMRHKG